jgi:hypothetical protein
MTDQSTVDVNIPRFNRAVVAAATGLAFLLGAPRLVAATFVVVALSGLGGLAPLSRLYAAAIRPRLAGPIEVEPAAPPRFSQRLAAAFLGIATGAPLVGWTTLGWAIAVLVTVLAATTRVCVGCLVYRRLGATS